MTDRCFRCHRTGHWAKECDQSPCPRCHVPMDRHTEAGATECAWRGGPCQNCGQPPHPDYEPTRCDQYSNPGDTLAERQIRLVTPWRRMADPDTFYQLADR